jgi:hypothetical protein
MRCGNKFLERINSPIFLLLFNIAVLVAYDSSIVTTLQEHIHCTGNWPALTRICTKLTLKLMRYVNLQNGKLRNVGLRIAYKLRWCLQYLSFDLCEMRQGTIYFCVGGMPGACLADHDAVTGIPHLVVRHGIPNKSHAKTYVVFLCNTYVILFRFKRKLERVHTF